MKRWIVLGLGCMGLSSASASGLPTPIADLQHGATVTVAGTVTRITDEDEFRLTDGSGTVRVYIGPNWVPAHVGEAVVVDGIVDGEFSPYEISAQSLVRADGTIVNFDYRYD